MIGNDIIDLALTKKQSNWRRKGFLDKIFTKKEQLIIENAVNSEETVWNLWSRKEAAYKIYNRETGIRGYFPIHLECTYENENSGIVTCRGFNYYTETLIVQDKIHTIAVIEKQDLKRVVELDPSRTIIKKEGVPFLFDAVRNEFFAVSLSHHGRFMALVRLKKAE